MHPFGSCQCTFGVRNDKDFCLFASKWIQESPPQSSLEDTKCKVQTLPSSAGPQASNHTQITLCFTHNKSVSAAEVSSETPSPQKALCCHIGIPAQVQSPGYGSMRIDSDVAFKKKINYLKANMEHVWVFQFNLINYLGSSNYLFEIGIWWVASSPFNTALIK